MGEVHDLPVGFGEMPQGAMPQLRPKGKEEEKIDVKAIALTSVKCEPHHAQVSMPCAQTEYPVLQKSPQNIKNDEGKRRIPTDDEVTAAVRGSTEALSAEQKTGRKTLLEAMKDAPGQLAKDITRLGRLEVGGHEISRTDKRTERTRTAGDMYTLTATNIQRLVTAKNPALLGPVRKSMNEILYACSQHLMVAPYGALQKALEGKNPGQAFWAPSTKPTLSVSFDLKGSSLEITQIGSVEFFNTADPEAPEKKAMYGVTTKYDLATQDVTFVCRYLLDGKGTEWQTSTPFKET